MLRSTQCILTSFVDPMQQGPPGPPVPEDPEDAPTTLTLISEEERHKQGEG